MDFLFYISAVLILFIGCAHSYLGERFILRRLFRRGGLPKLLGGEAFTKQTLRFAWHVTTIAWFGLAVLTLYLTQIEAGKAFIGTVIGVVFLLHFAVALIGSKGKHLSWIIFLMISISTIVGANA